MRLRTRIARLTIRWRKFKKEFYTQKKPGIDENQKKAIELFMALLKNKDTNLIHSPESSTRIIDSDFVWMTMTSKVDAYLLNIIDETKNTISHSHEIHIPKEHGYDMVDEFDLELEKRFRSMEVTKRRLVIDDLDKLIIKVKNQKK